MNRKILLTLALVSLMTAGTLYLAQAQPEPAAAAPGKDQRLDTIIEQNAQIIKGQTEIKKSLDDLRQDILQLRRRTS